MIGIEKNVALTHVIKTAVRVDGATSGALFLLNRTENVLRIGAHTGLPDGYVPDAVVIREGDGTASGDAAFSRHRVVVRDVSCDEYSLWRTNALELGINAIQAAPLVDDASRLLGVLSTFYDKPHHPTQHSLRRLDLCGELAVAVLLILEGFDPAERALNIRDRNGKTISDAAVNAAEAIRALLPVCAEKPYCDEALLAILVHHFQLILKELMPPPGRRDRHVAHSRQHF